MVSQQTTIAELIEDVLEERALRFKITDQEIEARAALLRSGFARIRAAKAERQVVLSAIAQLPEDRRAGWLSGVEAAVKVVLGEARRTSQVLVDAARDLLPSEPGAWAFAPAALALTRSGEPDLTRADSIGGAGEPTRTIIADDSGEQPRILATIRNFSLGEAPPVLLIINKAESDGSRAIEIDPEVSPEKRGTTGQKLCRLRYEAILPPGEYKVFFGNPRSLR